MIDVVCYRKWGHNEGDDPTLTQPMMYKKVSQHPGARALYTEQLIAEGVVTQAEADGYIQAYRDALDKGEHVEQTTLSNFQRTQIDWSKYQGKDWREKIETGLPAADIERLTEKFTAVPGRLCPASDCKTCDERVKPWHPANSLSTGAWPKPSHTQAC